MNSKGKSRRVDSESSDDSASDGEEKSSRSEWSEGTKQKHRVSFADPLPTSEKVSFLTWIFNFDSDYL